MRTRKGRTNASGNYTNSREERQKFLEQKKKAKRTSDIKRRTFGLQEYHSGDTTRMAKGVTWVP